MVDISALNIQIGLTSAGLGASQWMALALSITLVQNSLEAAFAFLTSHNIYSSGPSSRNARPSLSYSSGIRASLQYERSEHISQWTQATPLLKYWTHQW